MALFIGHTIHISFSLGVYQNGICMRQTPIPGILGKTLTVTFFAIYNLFSCSLPNFGKRYGESSGDEVIWQRGLLFKTHLPATFIREEPLKQLKLSYTRQVPLIGIITKNFF